VAGVCVAGLSPDSEATTVAAIIAVAATTPTTARPLTPACAAEVAVFSAVASAVVTDFEESTALFFAEKLVETKVEVKTKAPNAIVATNFFNFSPHLLEFNAF
jgi:hypothetical protein